MLKFAKYRIGKSIFNFYNIEVNPICYEVNNYRNLLINSNTLITAIRKIRPKVIIFDHLGASLGFLKQIVRLFYFR